MKTLCRSLLSVLMVFGLTCLGSVSVAQAKIDDEHSLIDAQGRTLTIRQVDTFLNGVTPLDRNRLTREWFHSGRAAYEVTGPGASDFTGVLELGYQVSFPWGMGVGMRFNYTTPNVGIWGWGGVGDALYTPPLIPGASISVDVGNGPGIQEIATVSVDVSEPAGTVSVSNAHGTVTGAAGGVLLRPFARIINSAGEAATTYGAPWNMN